MAHGIRTRGLRVSAPAGAVPIVVLWFLWLLAATLSTAGNLRPEPAAAYVWAYVLPFLMLMSLIALKATQAQARMVIASLALGWLIRFAYGAWVFVSTWGVPRLDAVLMAHFDRAKMLPYEMATYGNTSSTAALITPALVLLIVAFLSMRFSRLASGLILAAIAMLAVNGLITGSRGLFLIGGLVLVVASFKLKSRWGVPLLLILLAGAYYLSSNLGADQLGRFAAVATRNVAVDASLQERLQSIGLGIDMMLSRPFGVGPTMGYLYNRYFVAHQFAVNQGAELGVAGFLASGGLAVVIATRAILTPYRPNQPADLIFRFGALTWVAYAMVVNISLGAGPNMPWIGVLVLYVALGEMTAPDEARVPRRARASRRDDRTADPAPGRVRGFARRYL